eukprot:5865511-Ditylum_brightwellii.AAC.1
MMSIQQGINYRNTYFKITGLTKIHGESTTGLLLTLKNEIKANVMMVPTTLGVGACGHLGLVLDVVQYSIIPGTVPYAKPIHPGPLNMTQVLRQYQITQA